MYIKSSCGGVASCTDCRIKVIAGEDSLTTPPFEEVQLLGNVFHITKERLSCQAKIFVMKSSFSISLSMIRKR